MRRKKLICAIMVLVLLLSSAPPALAVETTVITGTTVLPVINVVVPAGTATLINPLNLPVSIDGSESVAQVISQPGYIANLSDVRVSVDVTVYAAIKTGSTMKLASAPTKGVGSQKEAFLYFEMIQSDSSNTDTAEWADEYFFLDHIIIADKVTSKKSGIVILPAASAGMAAQGGYALYRVAGDAVTAPRVEWSDADGVTVQVAFTFTPLPYI